jgi:threonylcarbamoyladenosine tRNA methylthiotransferase MtaB
MRIAITTLGCKVNQYESRALEEALAARGHAVVAFGDPADAVVVNSCTVTHRSDRGVRSLVRRARRQNPGARIAVTGCYAQVAPEELRALGVDLVVGSADKQRLPELLEAGLGGVQVQEWGSPSALGPEPVTRFGDRARAFFKVQDGCEAFCAYCIVPHARGPSRSLPRREVRAGFARLHGADYDEVVLTGVHLGNWGRDLNPPRRFEELLDAAEASGVPRVRLSSLEPGELTPQVVARLAASEVLCPHLHVPLQAGSDRTLAAMGRPYTVAAFAEAVRGAATAIPWLCLGCDVIVGFPGEGDAEFAATERLLEALPVSYLHVFPFSPRRSTPAWGMEPKVAAPVIKKRARRLRALSRRKRQAFWQSQVGRQVPALVEEGPCEGVVRTRTRNYVPVTVPWEGAVSRGEINVVITEVEEGGTRGRVAP